MKPDIASAAPAHVTLNKERIVAFLAENAAALLRTLRLYVRRMGLAQGEEATGVAVEVLQEVALEALEHADRFQPTGQPMAWLLGIGANVIKRKKVERAKRFRRELLISELPRDQAEPLNDDELFDQITAATCAEPCQEIAANEQAEWLLSLVSAEDRHILLLAFLCGFEREALGTQLGVSAPTARVRLHRALKRLRLAWSTQHAKLLEGADNE